MSYCCTSSNVLLLYQLQCPTAVPARTLWNPCPRVILSSTLPLLSYCCTSSNPLKSLPSSNSLLNPNPIVLLLYQLEPSEIPALNPNPSVLLLYQLCPQVIVPSTLTLIFETDQSALSIPFWTILVWRQKCNRNDALDWATFLNQRHWNLGCCNVGEIKHWGWLKKVNPFFKNPFSFSSDSQCLKILQILYTNKLIKIKNKVHLPKMEKEGRKLETGIPVCCKNGLKKPTCSKWAKWHFWCWCEFFMLLQYQQMQTSVDNRA